MNTSVQQPENSWFVRMMKWVSVATFIEIYFLQLMLALGYGFIREHTVEAMYVGSVMWAVITFVQLASSASKPTTREYVSFVIVSVLCLILTVMSFKGIHNTDWTVLALWINVIGSAWWVYGVTRLLFRKS